MSFDPKAFLESCVGDRQESLFGFVQAEGENCFNVRFGRRFGGNDSEEESAHFLAEWHPKNHLLSFCIVLPYEDFGLCREEEGVILVDEMNRHADQAVRFSTFFEKEGRRRSKWVLWICARNQLVVAEKYYEPDHWDLLHERLTEVLEHLVGEVEWHIRHSSKPSLAVIQTN